MSEPTHGYTKLGHAVHAKTSDHLPDGSLVNRVNSWLAVKISTGVGTMWCAYLFAALDLYVLPDAVKAGQLAIVQWIAQTFLQLVLLSIIMVGQDVQAKAADARAAKTFEDTELIVGLLDTHTQGGLSDVLAAIEALKKEIKC
jgi:hypothetical protein